jgi:outer membrane protein, adhesin transport system
MQLSCRLRPRPGALFLSAAALVGICTPILSAAQPSEPLPASLEQLRVYGVGDQLVRYLGDVVDWSKQPQSNRRTPAETARSISEALAQHPDVLLIKEQRASAQLSIDEAEGAYFPKISATLETGGKRNDPVVAPWASVPAYRDNSRAVNLTGRQLVYDFGATSSQVDSRKAELEGVQERLSSKTSETALRAVSAWIELQRSRLMVSLADMNLAARKQILEFVQEREGLGASSVSDVLRARARVTDAQSIRVVEANRQSTSESVFQEMFNTSPLAGTNLPPLPVVSRSSYPDLTEVRERNPVLREARASTRAAQAAARSVEASLRPGVFFELSLRRRDLGSAATPGTDWSAGLVLNQSLYSGGVDTARLRLAQQKASEALVAEAALVRQLDRALSQTLSNLENAQIAVEAKRQSVEVAAVALQAVREQFAYRRGSLLDLLKAQEELFVAGREFVDSYVDQTLIAYRWLHLSSELDSTLGLTKP